MRMRNENGAGRSQAQKALAVGGWAVITPKLANQENRSALIPNLFYWEGSVRIESESGERIGRGTWSSRDTVGTAGGRFEMRGVENQETRYVWAESEGSVHMSLCSSLWLSENGLRGVFKGLGATVFPIAAVRVQAGRMFSWGGPTWFA